MWYLRTRIVKILFLLGKFVLQTTIMVFMSEKAWVTIRDMNYDIRVKKISSWVTTLIKHEYVNGTGNYYDLNQEDKLEKRELYDHMQSNGGKEG